MSRPGRYSDGVGGMIDPSTFEAINGLLGLERWAVAVQRDEFGLRVLVGTRRTLPARPVE